MVTFILLAVEASTHVLARAQSIVLRKSIHGDMSPNPGKDAASSMVAQVRTAVFERTFPLSLRESGHVAELLGSGNKEINECLTSFARIATLCQRSRENSYLLKFRR